MMYRDRYPPIRKVPFGKTLERVMNRIKAVMNPIIIKQKEMRKR